MQNQRRCYVTAPGIDIGLVYNRASCKSGIPCILRLPDNRTVMRKGTELSLLEPQIPPGPWRMSAQDIWGQTVTVGDKIHAVQGQYANAIGIVCGLTRNYALVKKKVSTGKLEIVPMRVSDAFRCDTKPMPASILRRRTILRKTDRVFHKEPTLADPSGEENEPKPFFWGRCLVKKCARIILIICLFFCLYFAYVFISS